VDVIGVLEIKMKIRTFANFLKERFSFPVKKIGIQTLWGCPHRENRTGKGGCYYCDNRSFVSGSLAPVPIEEQIRTSIEFWRKKRFSGKFIAYFQGYTNTYAPIEILKQAYDKVYQFKEDIVGLSISTRPDCIDRDVVNLIQTYCSDFMVWLEIGLQSVHNRTLELINRGHSYEDFVNAVGLVREGRDILICAHIILGLPGETKEDMAETIQEINRLKLDGVKIHHLQIVRGTVFHDWYNQGKIDVMDWQEYLDLLLYLVPKLDPKVVVHRLLNDCPKEMLIAPHWSVSKQEFLNEFYRRLSLLG